MQKADQTNQAVLLKMRRPATRVAHFYLITIQVQPF